MEKTTTTVLVALLAVAGLLLAAPALGQMGGWAAPFGGPWGGMMGGGMMGGSGMGGMMGGGPWDGMMGAGMSGGGHCPMMSGGSAPYGPGAGTRDAPVAPTEARSLAERYIAESSLNLTVTAVKERRAVFEVETQETDGTPGISIFVAKRTGAVWPEMGPQAMGAL